MVHRVGLQRVSVRAEACTRIATTRHRPLEQRSCKNSIGVRRRQTRVAAIGRKQQNRAVPWRPLNLPGRLRPDVTTQPAWPTRISGDPETRQMTIREGDLGRLSGPPRNHWQTPAQNSVVTRQNSRPEGTRTTTHEGFAVCWVGAKSIPDFLSHFPRPQSAQRCPSPQVDVLEVIAIPHACSAWPAEQLTDH